MRTRIFLRFPFFLVSSFTFAESSESSVTNRCDSILQRVQTSCSGGITGGLALAINYLHLLKVAFSASS